MPVRRRIAEGAKGVVNAAKGLVGRTGLVGTPSNEFGGVMSEPSKYPPEVSAALNAIFNKLDGDSDGVLTPIELARLNIGQDAVTHIEAGEAAGTLSRDQFLRACGPMVEGVDSAVPHTPLLLV